MNPAQLRALLDEVARGALDPQAAERTLLSELRGRPFEDLGFARVDHHRAIRNGFPEVILGLGKTPAQIAAIAAEIVRRGSTLLVTRATEAAYAEVRRAAPAAEYYADAGIIALRQRDVTPGKGRVLIVAAGTSDLPVAEEALVTARAMGNAVERLTDVGVAGLHRVLAQHEALLAASVIIVVAGMDGALPSVVGGLVRVPVIAVPTSVGYGASFDGLAALLAMLNSCASGIAVMNIDNGFGAAALAARILRV